MFLPISEPVTGSRNFCLGGSTKNLLNLLSSLQSYSVPTLWGAQYRLRLWNKWNSQLAYWWGLYASMSTAQLLDPRNTVLRCFKLMVTWLSLSLLIERWRALDQTMWLLPLSWGPRPTKCNKRQHFFLHAHVRLKQILWKQLKYSICFHRQTRRVLLREVNDHQSNLVVHVR